MKYQSISIVSAIICASQLVAVAGTTATTETLETPQPANPWEFRITPYGWLTTIDGSTGARGRITDVDASFSDILDVLDMAAALQFEARKDRWGVIGDVFYAKLGTSGTLAGPLQTSVNVEFEQFLGELEAFYRVSESPQGFVDLYAGLRYNSISLDLGATAAGTARMLGVNRSADQQWADPIIGCRTQWDLTDRWYLAGKADIGGFGASSDFTWNLQATAGYRFTEMFSAELGYRYFDTDYSDGGFTYDIAQAGAIISFNFRF